MKLQYVVPGDDLSFAGRASAEVKRALGRLGVDPAIIKRAAVSMYEAEMNMIIHGGGGVAEATISPDSIKIILEDRGPGIQDLELAMKEGYSTAPSWIREIGFGAGMGLPNIKRNADELNVESGMDEGTRVTIIIKLPGVQESAS